MGDDTTPTVEVTLDAMANGGAALGRDADGRVIFIPYSIPGETVAAQITEERGRIAFARGVTLIAASADRVLPECEHFGPGRCGGCLWQHIQPDAQRLLKQDVLADQMERVGGFTEDVRIRPVIASPKLWHYNYQMVFTISADGLLGFTSTDGETLVPIQNCEVLHPDLQDLYDQLDLDTQAAISRIRLVRGSDGEQMVVLTSREEEAPELELDIAASINLLLPDNAPINLAGSTHVSYRVLDKTYRVTAGSAFRANVEALPELVKAVLEALGDASSVLDLYAGVGLFGAFIAEKATYVTLVESYPPAATDADVNTDEYDHVDVIEGTVEDVLDAAEAVYDAAVINPPGSGLSVEVIDQLAALNLGTLVYVSSDMATFARDAKRLVRHGYQLDYIQPVDLAPQTHFLEMVARFSR